MPERCLREEQIWGEGEAGRQKGHGRMQDTVHGGVVLGGEEEGGESGAAGRSVRIRRE